MSLTIARSTIPTLTLSLKALNNILQKGEAYAQAKNIAPGVLENSRLTADMHPLKRQVQMVSDTVRRILCQLAEQPVPSVEDNEETFAQLQHRIQATLDFINEFDSAGLEGSEDKTITLPFGENGMQLDGTTFLMSFGLPNFYFHMATAYNILRENGVDVGKMDFLSA